jgi:FtsH-binding integral membrane protein
MAYSPDFRTNTAPAYGVAGAAAIDQGLRAYMLRVYNWMASGLLLTGVVAYGVANTSLIQLFYHPVPTEYGTRIAPTGLGTLSMFAPLAFVLVLSFGVNKLSRTWAHRSPTSSSSTRMTALPASSSSRPPCSPACRSTVTPPRPTFRAWVAS